MLWGLFIEQLSRRQAVSDEQMRLAQAGFYLFRKHTRRENFYLTGIAPFPRKFSI